MTTGRLVLPALRWREDGDFAHESAAIEAALEFGAGGFILFGGTADSVRSVTERLRRDAGRPLLIASDLERGAGQQVRGLAELPPPLALAALDEPAVIRGAGLLTAAEALSVGINWVLAPVADLDCEPDNPIVQTRAFGADPVRVSDAVASWIAGCEAGGALACAKHFPGHGRTVRDSHDTLPVVSASVEQLERDAAPFRAAIAAGVSTIMTAHVAYPALDPAGTPATFSSPILGRLRDQMGFQGLIVSDALMMGGAQAGRTTTGAALAALGAGVDLLLYPDDPVAVAEALSLSAQRDPRIASRVQDSLVRYERALRVVEANRIPDLEVHTGSASALGDWLLTRSMVRGVAPALRPPLGIEVVDDDLGGVWPPSSPGDIVTRTLAASGVAIGSGGSRVLVVLAEPRGFKGRAGLGEESRRRIAERAPGADLVVVCAHPRLAQHVPGEAPVLLAWHRQGLMQRSVARWLMEHMA
jgi:beta-glucosidase-like glycosyl hydrolase